MVWFKSFWSLTARVVIFDKEERGKVEAILANLPADHPAHLAYRRGADTLELADLIDRDDLAKQLKEAHLEAFKRAILRSGGYFTP